jgi:hypothetical protein
LDCDLLAAVGNDLTNEVGQHLSVGSGKLDEFTRLGCVGDLDECGATPCEPSPWPIWPQRSTTPRPGPGIRCGPGWSALNSEYDAPQHRAEVVVERTTDQLLIIRRGRPRVGQADMRVERDPVAVRVGGVVWGIELGIAVERRIRISRST